MDHLINQFNQFNQLQQKHDNNLGSKISLILSLISPCVQHGMLQCRFNKQNKMIGAEMMFDVMGFMQQLQVIELPSCHLMISCPCAEYYILATAIIFVHIPSWSFIARCLVHIFVFVIIQVGHF